MRRSLQNKVNLLGVLFVAFFLLMLPMFSQVKADTRNSLSEAKNTVMWQWSRDLAKNFKPDNLEDTEVEDYWADYGEEAQRQNPDCGADCGPDGDPDGDGVSNADEVREGRNPMCNEDELGHDTCKNADQFNETTPDDVLDRVPVVLLANETMTYGQYCQASLPSTTCRSFTFPVNESFGRIDLYLNVTQFQGNGWTFNVLNETGDAADWDGGSPSGGFSASPTSPPMERGRFEPGMTGEYATRLTITVGSAPGLTNGVWHLTAYGIR